MVSYDIPVISNIPGAAAYILKSWHANAIAYWQTGLPLTVTNSVANQNVPGVTSDRPDRVAAWAASSPSLNMWFNTAAFAPQVKGTAGNEAPNQLRGPHQRSLNLSLVRDFALRESLRLQFRVEGFNVTNTANFALPDGIIGDNTYGAITSTATNASPRQFQLALKLLF